MTEPDRQLAVCPGCDLSLYQLKLGYASASRNTIYIYTDYNIPLKKKTEWWLNQARDKPGWKESSNGWRCLLFVQSFMSFWAFVHGLSVVKDKRNDCLRSPISSASVSEFDGGVFAFTAQNSGAAEAPRTDGWEFLNFKAHSGCARGRRGGAWDEFCTTSSLLVSSDVSHHHRHHHHHYHLWLLRFHSQHFLVACSLSGMSPWVTFWC